MTFTQFMDTARCLAQGTTEGDWRSAASRAYDAVFHYFRELCELHGLNLGAGAQCHFNLYAGLRNCGDPVAASIASRVDAARQQRVIADYVFK